MSTLTKWVWQVRSGGDPGLLVPHYEFRVEDLYLPANPDQYPYVEGHGLTMSWRDASYPDDVARRTTRERLMTEAQRQATPVVRGHGVAGLPFWTERVTEDLSVSVSLATPEARFLDDMAAESVVRVSYQVGDQRWYVAQLEPAGSVSKIVATELV